MKLAYFLIAILSANLPFNIYHRNWFEIFSGCICIFVSFSLGIILCDELNKKEIDDQIKKLKKNSLYGKFGEKYNGGHYEIYKDGKESYGSKIE